jgi:CubicO group peptidase (beta-lactamase class C family)
MSVSKQFTAALIMRLVAAGELRIDDRVSQYLTDWPAEWNDVEIPICCRIRPDSTSTRRTSGW